MFRNVAVGAVVAIGLAVLPSAVSAAIYSPTQAELNAAIFADFIDNANPDFASLDGTTLVGGDAVKYDFTTDFDINDSLWRVAVENSDIALDLTPYDAFNITFSNPVVPDPGLNLRAQIFVRSVADTVFTGVNSVGLIAGTPVTLSISKQRIIDFGGDPADISSFGIEFFGGDDFLGTQFSATASTSPQPPNLEDHLVNSWETADNPGTPGVDERFEGWNTLQGAFVTGTVPHPDHTHLISTTGATQGTKALQIDRAMTGDGIPGDVTNLNFRWGSRLNLDANAGGGQPVGDYNGDNAVDAADYTRWRNNLGGLGSTLLNRDTVANPGPNVVEGDYTSWKARYGNTGGGTNPTVLAQVQEIVGLINDPDSYSVSFDYRFEDQFPNTNPGFAILHLSVQAADGAGNAWWQGPQFDVDLSPLGNGNPAIGTADFLLSQFDNLSENGVQSLKIDGLDPATQYVAFNLATNYPADGAPVTYKIYIDNFRIRHIAPEDGGGGLSGVPEPSTGLLALLAMVAGSAVARRRQA